MSFRDQLLKAAPVVLGPPPARNRARFPYTGTVEFQGLKIRVETRKGDTRSGVDQDGKPWSVTMPAHYGEFEQTEGTDGDPVDVFVGPDAHAAFAYVVHLQDPTTGEHDEDKVFLGFAHSEAARECFRAAYNRRDLQLGTMRKMSVGELRDWLDRRGEKILGGAALHKAATWRSRLAEFVGLDAFDDLEKGRSHKYLTRVPTGNPKRPWRYVYKLTERRGAVGVVAEDYYAPKVTVGTAIADGKGEGHWHVTHADHTNNGVIRVRHDETGEEREFQGDPRYMGEAHHKFAKFANEQHADAIKQETGRRKEARKREAHAALEVLHTLSAAQVKEPTFKGSEKITKQMNLYIERAKQADFKIADHMEAFGVSTKHPKDFKNLNKEASALHAELAALYPAAVNLKEHLSVEHWRGDGHIFESNDPALIKKALRYLWLMDHGMSPEVDDNTQVLRFRDVMAEMKIGTGRWTHEKIVDSLTRASWMQKDDLTYLVDLPDDRDLDDPKARKLYEMIVAASGGKEKHRLMVRGRLNLAAHDLDKAARSNGYNIAYSVNAAYEKAFRDARFDSQPRPELYREDYKEQIEGVDPAQITQSAESAGEHGADQIIKEIPVGSDPVISITTYVDDPKAKYGTRGVTLRGTVSRVIAAFRDKMASEADKPRKAHAERLARTRGSIQEVAAQLPDIQVIGGADSEVHDRFVQTELARRAKAMGVAVDDKMRAHVQEALARGRAQSTGRDPSVHAWNMQREVFKAFHGTAEDHAGWDSGKKSLWSHPEWSDFRARHRAAVRDHVLGEVQRSLGYQGDVAAGKAHLERFTPEEAAHVRMLDTLDGKPLETTVHPYDLDADHGGLAKLLGFIHPDVAPRARVEGVEIKDTPDVYWRAHCTHDNVVRVWQGGVKERKEHGYRTLWHEFGHAIEHDNPGITAAANTLRDERGKASGRKKLREVEGTDSYADHEVTYEDKWAEGAYVGKWYGHQGPTEVLSMGVEALLDDPVLFHSRDPEHFHFTVTALAGRFGKAVRNRHGDATEKLRKKAKEVTP
jgi:hypothetical protein